MIRKKLYSLQLDIKAIPQKPLCKVYRGKVLFYNSTQLNDYRSEWEEYIDIVYPIKRNTLDKDNYEINIVIGMKNPLSTPDCDNCVKALFDICTLNNLIFDDSQVTKLIALKKQSNNAYVKVDIYLLN